MARPAGSLEEALDRIMKQEPAAPPPNNTGLQGDGAPPQLGRRRGTLGVTRHKRTQRFEAHIWSQKKQVYLGAYDSEVQAARGHDIMALHSKGTQCELNFPRQDYVEVLPFLAQRPQTEVVAALRNYSKSLTGGKQQQQQRGGGSGGSGGGASTGGRPPAGGIKRKLPQPAAPRPASAGSRRQAAKALGGEWVWGPEAGGLLAPDPDAAAAAGGGAPVRQSQRQRQRAAVAAAAAAANPSLRESADEAFVEDMEDEGEEDNGNAGAARDPSPSPFFQLSIEPLQLRPAGHPRPIRTTLSGVGPSPAQEGQLPPGRTSSLVLQQPQRGMSTAGSLGGLGTPLSPASSLGVKNLLSLANQLPLTPHAAASAPGSPQGQGLMGPPPPIPPQPKRLAKSPARPLPGQLLPASGLPLPLPPGWPPLTLAGGPATAALMQQLQSAGLVLQVVPGPMQPPGTLPPLGGAPASLGPGLAVMPPATPLHQVPRTVPAPAAAGRALRGAGSELEEPSAALPAAAAAPAAGPAGPTPPAAATAAAADVGRAASSVAGGQPGAGPQLSASATSQGEAAAAGPLHFGLPWHLPPLAPQGPPGAAVPFAPFGAGGGLVQLPLLPVLGPPAMPGLPLPAGAMAAANGPDSRSAAARLPLPEAPGPLPAAVVGAAPSFPPPSRERALAPAVAMRAVQELLSIEAAVQASQPALGTPE